MPNLPGFAQWLIDLLLYVPRLLFAALMNALAELLTAIPVPSWLDSAGSAFLNLSAGVMYWLEWFQLGTGISIVLSAYGLRFLIRRLPFIG